MIGLAVQCHTLFGEGGKVGPDLTGSNRANLDYALMNILDPSAVIAKEYRPTIVITTDGRVITGKDALAAKLIDEIGDLNAAIAKAMTLGSAPGSMVVKYETPGGIGRLFRMLGKAEPPKKIEINVGAQAALPLKPGYQYLLPSILVP